MIFVVVNPVDARPVVTGIFCPWKRLCCSSIYSLVKLDCDPTKPPVKLLAALEILLESDAFDPVVWVRCGWLSCCDIKINDSCLVLLA